MMINFNINSCYSFTNNRLWRATPINFHGSPFFSLPLKNSISILKQKPNPINFTLVSRVFLHFLNIKVRLTCIRPAVLTKKRFVRHFPYIPVERVYEEQQPRKKTIHYYVCVCIKYQRR